MHQSQGSRNIRACVRIKDLRYMHHTNMHQVQRSDIKDYRCKGQGSEINDHIHICIYASWIHESPFNAMGPIVRHKSSIFMDGKLGSGKLGRENVGPKLPLSSLANWPRKMWGPI